MHASIARCPGFYPRRPLARFFFLFSFYFLGKCFAISQQAYYGDRLKTLILYSIFVDSHCSYHQCSYLVPGMTIPGIYSSSKV